MIERKMYVNKIIPFIGKPFIKILTGIRRSGKSTIMLMLINTLKGMEISENQIFHTKFDSLEYENLTTKRIIKIVKIKIS